MKPEPATVITAATSAVDAMIILADACSRSRQPLAGQAATVKRVLQIAQLLGDALPIEAFLAARDGYGDLEPREGETVNRRLRDAASHVGAAAENLYHAWRAARARAGGGEDGDSRTLQLASSAARRMAELGDALRVAERHRIHVADLDLVAVHRQLAEALALIARHLGRVCDNLRDSVRDAFTELGPGTRKHADRVTGPLFSAVMHFKDARARTAAAEAELADTWTRRRKTATAA